MVSLTNRINQIKQPYGGFIPVKDMNIRVFFDDMDNVIPKESTFEPQLKGLIVDYLTRIYLGFSKKDAFKISLLGANLISESEIAYELLSLIDNNNIDDQSIIAAYSLVSYDVVFRRGLEFYKPVNHKNMNDYDIAEIRSMVLRTLNFFKKNDQSIIDSGITFKGGYNKNVSSADADFISTNTLWDLKSSKNDPTSKDTLQLLGYYLLGVRSGNSLFDGIDTIGIYNPRLNKSYTLLLKDIGSDVTLLAGSALFGDDFMSLSMQNWILSRFSEIRSDTVVGTYKYLNDNHGITDFNVDDYSDGIYEISKDDYWTYCKDKFITSRQPQYAHTKRIMFLKNDGYVMFISENKNGNHYIMNGGSLKKLNYSVDYYFEKLPKYANLIISLFGDYFNHLQAISEEIRYMVYNSDFTNIDSYLVDFLYRDTGRVHGSIVDIDYYNHISIDFPSGELTIYNANNMAGRKVYPSIKNLIMTETPILLPAYDEIIELKQDSILREIDLDFKNKIIPDYNGYSLINVQSNLESVKDSNMNVLQDNDISPLFTTDTTMYSKSLVLKKLQRVFIDKHIVLWVDILADIGIEQERD